MKLTVICVYVSGHVPFTSDYVVRLRSMARRTLPDHRFVCLTDRPHELPMDISTIPAKVHRGLFGWWSKIQLFDPTLPVFGRMLYLDLDVLLVQDLAEVANYPSRFALVPDGAPDFKPSNGRKVVKKFNSSVMVWEHGEQRKIFDDWNPAVANVLWGDQDWIGMCCPYADVMPAEWFPRLSVARCPPWPEHAKVILCKKPKNAEARMKLPWFEEAWQ